MFSKFMVYMLTLVLGSLAGSTMVLGNAAGMDNFYAAVGASFGIKAFHMVSRVQYECANFNQDVLITWSEKRPFDFLSFENYFFFWMPMIRGNDSIP